MPEKMPDFCKEFSRDFEIDCNSFFVDAIPYKFNLTLLKTETRLSIEKQAKILKALGPSNKEIFLATANKHEGMNLHKRTYTIKRAGFFKVDKYDQVVIAERKNRDVPITIMITYCRSPLCQGSDFPNVVIALIDCCEFIPYAGLPDVNPLMTKQEIEMAMLKDVAKSLTQVIGRFLRSNLPVIPGETTIEPMQKTVLLHGLPKKLMAFNVDERLCNQYQEYIDEEFLSIIEEKQVESILKAIELDQGNKPIPNRFDMDKEKILEKAREYGIESISQYERILLTEQDRLDIAKARQEQNDCGNFLELQAKVAAMAKEGRTWTQTSNELHLRRLGKREYSKLKQIFAQNHRE